MKRQVRQSSQCMGELVAGRVVEVAVRENQAVHTGDLLFRIDPEPLQIAVEQMEAQIAAAADYLNASRDTFRSASADLRSTGSDPAHPESQLKRMREMRARPDRTEGAG